MPPYLSIYLKKNNLIINLTFLSIDDIIKIIIKYQGR
nr:MAG TPA: hypothetical protein [Caudoviricetes sp.]